MTEDNSHKGWKLLPGNSVPQAVLFCFPSLRRITLSLTSVRKVKPGSEFLTEEQDDGSTGVLVALCSHCPLTMTHLLLLICVLCTPTLVPIRCPHAQRPLSVVVGFLDFVQEITAGTVTLHARAAFYIITPLRSDAAHI